MTAEYKSLVLTESESAARVCPSYMYLSLQSAAVTESLISRSQTVTVTDRVRLESLVWSPQSLSESAETQTKPLTT